MVQYKYTLFSAVFLILLILPLSAEPVLPESLTVGVSLFAGTDLPPAYDYLKESLPNTLVDIISDCESHKLTSIEFEEIHIQNFTGKEEELKDEISSLRQGRDKLLFSTGEKGDRYEELSAEIAEKISELEAMEFNSPRFVETILPLGLANTNAEGNFFDPLIGDPEYFEEEELDYLLWGYLENLDGLLYMYYEIYSFISSKIIFFREKVFLPETSAEVLEEDRDEIWNLFLGRPWSRITVNSDPPAALIELDGGDSSTRRFESGFIDPGEHDISISAYGFKSLNEALTLRVGEEAVFSYQLKADSRKRIPLRSYPGGADVYLGAQWAGKTPLFLDIASDFTRILVRKEGYDDYSYYIAGERSEGMTINLHKSVFNWDSYVESRRDNFYRSLGTFFLSIPITVFLYSNYLVYSGAFLSEDTSDGISDEERRLFEIGNLSYYGSLGSVYVNTILFCDMVFKAVDYVKSAGQRFKE